MSIIHSFRSISTRFALVLTNSLPIEKRALHLAALATLKGNCSGNEFVADLLRKANIEETEIDPPYSSYGLQAPPYQPLSLSIVSSSNNFHPNFLPEAANTFFCFTDGSKTEQGTGYVAILTNSDGIVEVKSRRLPNLCTIFEAEAHVIYTSLKMANKQLLIGSTVAVFSDSRSALQALVSHSKTIPLIAQIQKFPLAARSSRSREGTKSSTKKLEQQLKTRSQQRREPKSPGQARKKHWGSG